MEDASNFIIVMETTFIFFSIFKLISDFPYCGSKIISPDAKFKIKNWLFTKLIIPIPYIAKMQLRSGKLLDRQRYGKLIEFLKS